MFLKILWIDRTDDKQRAVLHEALYECRRFIRRPVKDRPSEIEIVLEGPSDADAINLIAEKREVDIFVMNEAGQTIDRFHGSYLP